MKLDMDLMRQILLAVEADPCPVLPGVPEVIDYPSGHVIEHVRLAVDAGYLTAQDAGTMSGPDFVALRLTWAGHEFLEKIRDPEIWRQTKAGAAKVGSLPFSLLGELAIGFLKKKAADLGLPMM